MKNPQVTIAIPVYNTEKYLNRCLDSVVNQTLHNIEIIIVDDGSTDSSMQIAYTYAQQDSRIKVIRHSENLGLMMARKTGYKAATGDYICFVDSDDSIPLDAIKSLYSTICNSNVDIVAGNIAYYHTDTLSRVSYDTNYQYGNNIESIIKSTLRWEATHNLCGKIYKRSLLQEHEYQTYKHMTLGEDGALFYQLLYHCHCVKGLDQVVYNYYQNAMSSSNSWISEKKAKDFFVFFRIRHEIVSKYEILHNELRQTECLDLVNLCSHGVSRSFIKKETRNILNVNPISFTEIHSALPLLKALKAYIQIYILHHLRNIIQYKTLLNN